MVVSLHLNLLVVLICNSNVENAVFLVGKRNIFDHEIGINFQITTEHLCWHHLSYVCIYDLLPSVS